MTTNREKIAKLYKKCELTPDDVFKHQHYTIITRAGIDKIQGVEQIQIHYDVIECKTDFAVVKANAKKEETHIQTFGSALKGDYKRVVTVTPGMLWRWQKNEQCLVQY